MADNLIEEQENEEDQIQEMLRLKLQKLKKRVRKDARSKNTDK